MDEKSQAVLEFAHKYGIIFDEEDAALFLANRARLAADPTDAEALRIAKHFESVLWRASDDDSLEYYLAWPDCEWPCPECLARAERQNARSLELYDAANRAAIRRE